MNWFEGIVYGIVSGVSAFLPVSTKAHQMIVRNVMGMEQQPLLDIFICIGLLMSLLIACRPTFSKLHRERLKSMRRVRGRPAAADTRSLLDIRLVKTAAISMIIGTILLLFVLPEQFGLHWVAIILIVNGVILFVPEHMRHGNKDSRQMSRMDSFLMGMAGALSILPGISRIGACMSAAVARGAERHLALHWALLLSVPGIALMMSANVLDLVRIGFGAVDFAAVLIYLLSMAAAFVAGYFSVRLMRLLVLQADGAGFAYYSWGAALFAFILYLI